MQPKTDYFQKGVTLMQNIKTENKDGKSNLTITKRTRSTNYIVGIHFSATSKENIEDKILRLIKNDIASEK